LEPPKRKGRYASFGVIMNTRSLLGLHAKALGVVLNRGAQDDVRGATQVLSSVGQKATGRCPRRRSLCVAGN
jgi:hypothetical protein